MGNVSGADPQPRRLVWPLRLPRSAMPARVLVTGACWLLALTGLGTLIYVFLRRGMVDLVVYRSGAAAILHGARLYQVRTAAGLPFTYPPLAAMLATPLAALPLQLAMLAWIPMVYGPLAVAIWFGFRPLLDRAGNWSWAAFACLLGGCAVLTPIWQEMGFGQIDLFLLALCLLDCAVPRPRWPRGILIGLATAIKLVPGVFIIYLLITGRRKAAAIAVASFAVSTGAAFAVAPRDSITYWTGAIFDSSRLGANAAAGNQSLRGMILRAFLPGHAPPVVWLVAAAAVAVAGFAAARACWLRGDEMAGIAITGLLAAALSPVAWIHHLCWVVVAIGVVVGTGRDWRRVAVAVLAFALFVSWLPIWAQADVGARQGPGILARLAEDSFGLAALVLIGVLAKVRTPGASLVPTDAVEPALAESELAGSGLGRAEQSKAGLREPQRAVENLGRLRQRNPRVVPGDQMSQH
jgi:alpha-1,2-mannosyltransferase